VINIVYISKAVSPPTAADAIEQLSQFRAHNQKRSITGILLYQEGHFMQSLEGEESVVRELYARIKSDVRHTSVFTLIDQPIEKREFEEWSMAFGDLDEAPIPDPPDFSQFLTSLGRSGDYR